LETLESREVPHNGMGPEGAWPDVAFLGGRITPPEQTDTTFVIDQGAYLDTGCSYRSEGPLMIDISPTRYIGDKDALLAQGLIPSEITLRFPAFDVDVNGAPGLPNEVDIVTFIDSNGVEHQLQHPLAGDNDIWHENVYTIPTEWLDFGTLSRGGTNEVGTYQPGTNTLKVDIDTLSAPDENWCTSIDWVSYQIPAPNPVLLVHGINPGFSSSPDTWGTDGSPGPFMSGLTDMGIPFLRVDLGHLDYISSNSGKLENYYQQMRSNWATDPNQGFHVDVISHSHGGLDTRDWVENRDRVDQLIQLGTPNAGSPLADAVQVGLFGIDLLTDLPVGMVADLAAPAAYELTTGFMSDYNSSHLWNPNVHYSSYAGDYTFGGQGYVDAALDLLYDGPSDTIVPVWSVNSFPPSSKTTYSTSGNQTDAMHTSMTTSQYLASQVLPQLRQPAANVKVRDSRVAAAPINPAPKPIESDPAGAAGTVAVGVTNTHPIVIDNTTGATRFVLTYDGGDLDLELVSPSNIVYNVGNIGGNPNVTAFSSNTVPGLVQEGFIFAPGAEKGTWLAKVTGVAMQGTATKAVYAVSVDEEKSSITMEVSTDQTAVVEGTPFKVTARLKNGSAAIRGATVSGELRKPDGTIVPFALHDDGLNGDKKANDGLYTATVSDPLPTGLYEMRVTADGPTALPFTRQKTDEVAVAAAGSAFGTVSMFGIDTNDNFLFDKLETTVGVQAAVDGQYRVTATLADARGKPIQTLTAVATMTAGQNTVMLDFDGSKIYSHRRNGPLKLINVKLEQDVGGIYATAVKGTGTYFTSSDYAYASFEHQALILRKGGSARTTDTDHDHFFNSLVVKLPVWVDTAGQYVWSGTLVDTAGHPVTNASGATTLKKPFHKGVNLMTFTFPGESVFNSHVDGPYRIAGVLLDGPSGVLVADSLFTTRSYPAASFETGHVLAKATLAIVPPAMAGQPVDQVTVTFSAPILDGSFTTDDLVLKLGKNAVTLTPAVTVTKVDDTHYTIAGLASVASTKGAYTLTLVGRSVSDADGFSLFNEFKTGWKVRV
jgi:triacylglycerol esterase/lipase EstA (alpha/beta hydrolase family)